MSRTPSLSLSLSLAGGLLASGCFADLFAHGDALLPDSDTSDDSTSTSEPMLPTTGEPGLQTATGDEQSTSTTEPGSGTGASANVPPEIVLFDGVPDFIGEAGPVTLQLVASEDVVSVRLSLDDEVLADDLTPADFPRQHFFLSAADNGPARSFRVVVEDDEGLTAAAMATVAVLLPAAGAEKCIFEDPGLGEVVSGVAALEYTPKAIFAVGSRDTGAGPRLTVWKLDPDTCKLQDGWPRTLANWTEQPALVNLTSVGAAVDVDATENIVVAGNFLVAGEPRSYVALLNPGGSLLWEHAGQLGDEVTGVAVATGQFTDRTFVVGSRRTSDAPVRTDGAIWMYQTVNNSVAVAPPTILRAPFTEQETELDEGNKLSEVVRAVVIDPGTDNALVVGERAFGPNMMMTHTRAFAVMVHPLGDVVGAPWTSPAATWFPHDAARSVAVCGDGFVAGGWTREDVVDAEPRPMSFWIEPDGTSLEQRAELTLTATETHGIACDREHKVVSAGTRSAGGTDAKVFMVPGPLGPRTLYEEGVAGNDGANAVACDPDGFCGWGGYRSANGKPYAVVRVHHP